MKKIFVSHTGVDSDWASWIGYELEQLGHEASVDRWELSAGGDIAAWMDEKLEAAAHCLCVCSPSYFGKTYSDWERRSAVWVSKTSRPGFVYPVFVEACEPPVLMSSLLRCQLFEAGGNEVTARKMLSDFLAPAGKPTTRPAFPPVARAAATGPAFPGSAPPAQSNIPITIPLHFLGRDDELAAIEAAFAACERVAITALQGLRGVGKTTLAAVVAHRHRRRYKATWWIRAETDDAMRADLAALGLRLGWIAANEKEEPAVARTLERLRAEGEGVLLLYDNATRADALRPFLPKSGAAKILVTANAPDWGGLAQKIEIRGWPKETGADFLLARAGRSETERAEAEALSIALGGLPLAHEQAGAYCARTRVSFAKYRQRFEAESAKYLDDEQGAAADYYDKRTVAKTFALAIEEAACRYPAAEALIVHAALLAPEPLPLFFFLEGREKLSEPLASLTEAELDEAVAALLAFALVDRDPIPDELDVSQKFDSIRLHRLVRIVAAARCEGAAREEALRGLVEAMALVYPRDAYDDPKTWPRARRLDAIALALVAVPTAPRGSKGAAGWVLDRLAAYRHSALCAYPAALQLRENALVYAEAHWGASHVQTATFLSNLALTLKDLGGLVNLARACELLERVLSISELAFGTEHPNVAVNLSNLATVLQDQGGPLNLARARELLERALAIDESAFGPKHPRVAVWLSNLALVLQDLGGPTHLARACAHLERALAIDEAGLGAEHVNVAVHLSNLAMVRRDIGGATNLALAYGHLERALSIDKAALGPDHPNVAANFANLAQILQDLGGSDNLSRALSLLARAKIILCDSLGENHPTTRKIAANLAAFRAAHGDG